MKSFEEINLCFGLRKLGFYKNDSDIEPLFSIIIPTFNSSKLIEQTLESIYCQTYKNYEIIIVDGHSTDNTLQILKKYADKLDVVISEPDKNIFDAINKGTFISNGRYSVFLGSDDMLLPNSLEIIFNSIKEEGFVSYFWGDMYTLREDGRMVYTKCFFNSINYGDFFISHPSLYIRKDVFEELDGFNIDYYICADADFELKLITNGYKGIKINQPLCIFRSGGHSSFKIENVKQVKSIFKKYYAKLGFKYFKFALKSYFVFTMQKSLPSDIYKKLNKIHLK